MFAREYQAEIISTLNCRLINIDNWHEEDFITDFSNRFMIMLLHLNLTFLPFCNLSLDSTWTYLESLAMNIVNLVTQPFIIIVVTVQFMFTGDLSLMEHFFDSILRTALTLIVLTLEIASGLLSLVTKPLITLGYLFAYTADFIINNCNTSENVVKNDSLFLSDELKNLLLPPCPGQR